MIKFILLLAILSLATSQCQPLFWEVDPNYVYTANQLSDIAQKLITPGIITQKKGTPATTYSITNIIGKVVYDASQQQKEKIGDSIVVRGAIFNISFTFNVSASNVTKKYSGVGTAHVDGIKISYTKTPLIINGSAAFNISSVNVTFPQIVPNNYTPAPSDSDKKQFDSLIKINLTNDVKQSLINNLTEDIKHYASLNGFPYLYTSKPYKYNYTSGINRSMVVTIDTTVTNLTTYDQGYLIGYNGAINGKSDFCSEYNPTDLTKNASIFSLEFIQSLYNQYLQNFSAWRNFTVNQLNSKSFYFRFRVIDLLDIVPDYLRINPKLTAKIQGRCLIDSDLKVEFQLDSTLNSVKTTAGWLCGLYPVDSDDIILKFYTLNIYELQVDQVDKAINVRIMSAKTNSSKWEQQDKYPISNQTLAEIYLADVVSGFNGQYTLGTGFQQPGRVAPKVTIWKDAIQIYEASTTLQVTK